MSDPGTDALVRTQSRMISDQRDMLRARDATIGELRGRIGALEDFIGLRQDACPIALSPTCERIFGVLLNRARIDIPSLVALLYGHLPDADRPSHPETVIRVQIHYLRRRLARYGIEFETSNEKLGDRSYRMAPAMRIRARAVIAHLMSGRQMIACGGCDKQPDGIRAALPGECACKAVGAAS